jgi:hypothetical protein
LGLLRLLLLLCSSLAALSLVGLRDDLRRYVMGRPDHRSHALQVDHAVNPLLVIDKIAVSVDPVQANIRHTAARQHG